MFKREAHVRFVHSFEPEDANKRDFLQITWKQHKVEHLHVEVESVEEAGSLLVLEMWFEVGILMESGFRVGLV